MYGQEVECAKTNTLTAIRNPTLTEQLLERQLKAQEELDQVTALLDMLLKNPEAAEIFDAVSKLGGLRNY